MELLSNTPFHVQTTLFPTCLFSVGLSCEQHVLFSFFSELVGETGFDTSWIVAHIQLECDIVVFLNVEAHDDPKVRAEFESFLSIFLSISFLASYLSLLIPFSLHYKMIL